jgi:hypothetical protein
LFTFHAGYNNEMMQEHLRRIIRIVYYLVRYGIVEPQVFAVGLVDNVILGGGCAQGFRNRLLDELTAVLDRVLHVAEQQGNEAADVAIGNGGGAVPPAPSSATSSPPEPAKEPDSQK